MKKKAKKQSKSIFKILVPDQVKRTSENADWYDTGKLFKKEKKKLYQH